MTIKTQETTQAVTDEGTQNLDIDEIKRMVEEATNEATPVFDPTFFSEGVAKILLRNGETGDLVMKKSRKLGGSRGVRLVVRERNNDRGVPALIIDAVIPEELLEDVEKAIRQRKDRPNMLTVAVAGVHTASVYVDEDGKAHLNQTLRVTRLTVLPNSLRCGPFGLTTFAVLRALEDGKMKLMNSGSRKGEYKGAFNAMRRHRAMNAEGEWIDVETRVSVFDRRYGRTTFIPNVVKSGQLVCVTGNLNYAVNSYNRSVDAVINADRIDWDQRPRIFAAVEVTMEPKAIGDGQALRVPVKVVWDANAVNRKTGATYEGFTFASYFVNGANNVKNFQEKVSVGDRVLLQNAAFDISARKAEDGTPRVGCAINGGSWYAIGEDAADVDNILYAVLNVYRDVDFGVTDFGDDSAAVSAKMNTFNWETKTQHAKFVKVRAYRDMARHIAEHVGRRSVIAVVGKGKNEEAFVKSDGELGVDTGIVARWVKFLTKSAGKPMLAEVQEDEPVAAIAAD